MSTSRAVRIARTPLEASSVIVGSGGAGATPFAPNRGGAQRGVRLFLLFVVVALAVYVTFVGLAASSPTSGVKDNPAVYVVLTMVAALIALVGFFITLGRAPRAAAWRSEHLLVRERLGKLRRFRRAGLQVSVVYRYTPGFLSTDPTELVTVTDADGRRGNYLVGRGFLDPNADV
ncbi:MAG: hypothetical protein L3K23_01080 [Thermoplasmata archaeon]|nr:hypothetical protein [Thermoplasmata archaeon]